VTNEQEIKLEARLLVIEYFLADNFRITYGLLGVSAEAIKQSHDKMREHVLTLRPSSSDPALSDLAAGEFQEAFGRMLDKIAESARGQRTGLE
jgi:hypothetical protein